MTLLNIFSLTGRTNLGCSRFVQSYSVSKCCELHRRSNWKNPIGSSHDEFTKQTDTAHQKNVPTFVGSFLEFPVHSCFNFLFSGADNFSERNSTIQSWVCNVWKDSPMTLFCKFFRVFLLIFCTLQQNLILLNYLTDLSLIFEIVKKKIDLFCEIPQMTPKQDFCFFLEFFSFQNSVWISLSQTLSISACYKKNQTKPASPVETEATDRLWFLQKWIKSFQKSIEQRPCYLSSGFKMSVYPIKIGKIWLVKLIK